MDVSAIIVAAGSSRRMGFDKLDADLAGESVLMRSLMAFEACSDVTEICVVTIPEKVVVIEEAAARLGFGKLVAVVEGGAERHLSVSAGLDAIRAPGSLVAVHDGARPLVTPSAISKCAAVAAETGAASLAHRVVDTLKRGNENNEVSGSVSRDGLWAMETPQIFELALLREAYRSVLASGAVVTDEVSAIESIGRAVTLVENDEPNLKITVPADLEIAAALLRAAE